MVPHQAYVCQGQVAQAPSDCPTCPSLARPGCSFGFDQPIRIHCIPATPLLRQGVACRRSFPRPQARTIPGLSSSEECFTTETWRCGTQRWRTARRNCFYVSLGPGLARSRPESRRGTGRRNGSSWPDAQPTQAQSTGYIWSQLSTGSPASKISSTTPSELLQNPDQIPSQQFDSLMS
jgi:hypothetical protein